MGGLRLSSRHYPDWLSAFIDYAQYGEAPKRMYFWVGVSAIAGALRRRVWIDQTYFKWHPNFYLILVAPPGIVSKSTTAAISMNLLRKVPGIKFGPDVVTWQALVSAFAEASETFIYQEEHHPMSAITIESSEFGNLLNPQDKDMVDLLVNLWDGKQGGFQKKTKHSGSDMIENPWINLIACTTPAWIAGNFPEYIIGGGFTSRCLFVYADTKRQYVAYPGLEVPRGIKDQEAKLIADLEHIAMNLCGEYKLTPAAVKYGKEWYEHHYKNRPKNLDDDRFGGYIARKQTHVHKLAMILSASCSDDLWIDTEQLALANQMVTDLEEDMPQVFSKIGRSDVSVQAERMIKFIEREGLVSYKDAYKFIHLHFPSFREFDDMMAGCLQSGKIVKVLTPDSQVLLKVATPASATTSASAPPSQSGPEPEPTLRFAGQTS